MREIKFRVWSKNLKQFVPVWSAIETRGDDILRPINCNFIIEQYTGLKDKNGVEIYEGDVISASVYGFRETGLVEYSPFGEWVFGNIRLNEFMSSLEVIGNIHENADLLEEE